MYKIGRNEYKCTHIGIVRFSSHRLMKDCYVYVINV